MSARDQERIRSLQAQLKIAKNALVLIQFSGYDYRGWAAAAVGEMEELEMSSCPPPLQGLVGHGEK